MEKKDTEEWREIFMHLDNAFPAARSGCTEKYGLQRENSPVLQAVFRIQNSIFTYFSLPYASLILSMLVWNCFWMEAMREAMVF